MLLVSVVLVLDIVTVTACKGKTETAVVRSTEDETGELLQLEKK